MATVGPSAPILHMAAQTRLGRYGAQAILEWPHLPGMHAASEYGAHQTIVYTSRTLWQFVYLLLSHTPSSLPITLPSFRFP